MCLRLQRNGHLTCLLASLTPEAKALPKFENGRGCSGRFVHNRSKSAKIQFMSSIFQQGWYGPEAQFKAMLVQADTSGVILERLEFQCLWG